MKKIIVCMLFCLSFISASKIQNDELQAYITIISLEQYYIKRGKKSHFDEQLKDLCDMAKDFTTYLAIKQYCIQKNMIKE